MIYVIFTCIKRIKDDDNELYFGTLSFGRGSEIDSGTVLAIPGHNYVLEKINCESIVKY